MVFVSELLQLVLPGAIARYLPVLLFGKHLEDVARNGLETIVIAIVLTLLILDLLLLHSTDKVVAKQLISGIIGLVLGSVAFHLIIVLFGAPVVDLWMHTLLLAIFLSSCVTMPLAIHFGCSPSQWLNLLLHLRIKNLQEWYLVCSSIGAMLGAYVGAFPIPLDWDRPWQQWPLTCVYGTLIGHAAGILISIVRSATSASLAAKETKKN
ncbi:phosphatidylinositol-glycan biosynthesis class f protein [Plasmopara halstedii]|uniref:Phosphatidylinositol-glycan biosynthesis class f protein n=1 Tax=Plasmopara halstedii TaxID=4781 RepID=A0A0P1ASM3_PLAHL|nr:phosphatidylinositol-glycan biosynthesis class f protein [Plasmopara halstedii]CEG44375.1 phosphatidylinositol-glycan biosynthesis class f protein [Plasmopara halstedii]|eukprot:XP_024580744.1 phosphatidylinositol-glycan biosynthesis class f protein [Plasmopara halstedii]